MENLNHLILNNLGVVVLVVAAVALVGLALALANFSRVRTVTSRFAWVSGEEESSADTLPALLKVLESHGSDITQIREILDGSIADGRAHMQRMGLVRYDAFDGIAGQQSFSLCLLDEDRNGVLINSLVGRDFSRSYAIEISDGAAPRKLGDEETQALTAAVNGR